MRISPEPALPPWPAESAHGLGGVAEITRYIKAKPGLAGQILQEGKGVVVGILMGKGLKLTPPLVARMGLEPRATRLQREERGIEHAGRGQHGLQLQQGREDRIEREMAEHRIGKSDLHRPINRSEIELIGGKQGVGSLFRNTGLTQHLLTEGDRAGIDVLPVVPAVVEQGNQGRTEPHRPAADVEHSGRRHEATSQQKGELHLLVFSPDALLLTILLLPQILKEHILPVGIFRLCHRAAGG